MLVKVLPSDPEKESYFQEIPGDMRQVLRELGRIVGGDTEIVKSQRLVDKFGYDQATGLPCVVMLVNEVGQKTNLPVNEKASGYYPNDYDLMIKGDAVLVGWAYVTDQGPENYGLDITDMPLKWKVIHDMETALAEVEYPGQLRGKLEELLLSMADPDVRKMYEEAREQMDWRRA